MVSTFSRSLSRKKVMSNDGMVIGTLKNVMVDLDSGQVIDLIVKPDSTFDATGYRIDGDRMLIPFEAVKDIKDYIVVDRFLSKSPSA
ncbi:PRC-barrel domain-containing protein [Methanosphaerula subterraneus]|jgi:sporulation protein YlmC with PRC-barrel domain|uniref:PRC-barrel domain-containing protein n=1 Tax=Methanosphaerula subterraneus TaxID=3350244 RepID=UPI003F860E3B